MATIEGQVFENRDVHLEGGTYRNCQFRGCRLVYSGGDIPSFVGCSFDRCSWDFEGAAGRTVAFMRALYHGGGGTLIENTLEMIRTPPERPTSH